MLDNNCMAVKDVGIFQLYKNQDKYILGSPSKDRYILASKIKCDEYYKILKLMDGKKNDSELINLCHIDMESLQQMKKIFEEKGLLDSSSNLNGASEINKLSLHLWSNKCRLLNSITPKWANRIMSLSGILILTMIIWCIYNVVAVGNLQVSIYRYKGSYFSSLIISSLIMIPSFFIHEIFHAITARKYALRIEKINLCLYLYFFPMAYVKINGIYTIKASKRIAILLAGFWGNLFLGLFALSNFFIFHNSLFITILVAQINIVVVNCNPFNLTDIYFVLNQVFRTVNLRYRSFRLIANFNKYKNRVGREVKCYMILNLLILIGSGIYEYFYYLNAMGEILHINFIKPLYIFIFSLVSIMIYYLMIRAKYRERETSIVG